ncbi:carboxypeptidase regulatory-like domain-containing protein [Thalassoroseus pseudoceratinae]|uniref:carboxypeptidase regulatory-like domain-containing protein n=1 Tax=Thalassoroseus pseudoceratinae TaxID=2713176 RepID=UPI001424529D|nr:carboxypeptidase regulatory-like domain-containing protein [Thalassoroseus pseudoceratinae]
MKRLVCHTLACTMFALTLSVISGCSSGPATGTVEGTVTLDGEPYEKGIVNLIDLQTGQAGNAEISTGGKFSISEPIQVGTYSVFVTPVAPPMPTDGSPPPPVVVDQSIPDKYRNESMTDIKVEVKEGSNTVAVEMKSE